MAEVERGMIFHGPDSVLSSMQAWKTGFRYHSLLLSMSDKQDLDVADYVGENKQNTKALVCNVCLC